MAVGFTLWRLCVSLHQSCSPSRQPSLPPPSLPHWPRKPQAQAYVPARTPDGYPNIEGVWRAWNLAKFDLEDHSAKPGIPAGRGFVVDPPDGRIPYRPEMLARRQKNYEGTLTPDPIANTDPLAKCYMPGVPRLTYLGWPFQIIQDQRDVNFTYEWSHKKRIVPIGDTSPLPDPDGGLNLRWNGMARGRYDGNSLVVTLGNFNGYTWFDMAGNFHSDALTVVERYTLIGPDTHAVRGDDDRSEGVHPTVDDPNGAATPERDRPARLRVHRDARRPRHSSHVPERLRCSVAT